MVLVHEPLVEPSVVFVFAIVGLAEVLQTIPLTVTGEPPFETIVPPLVAWVWVMPEAALVVTEGAVAADAHVTVVYPAPESPVELVEGVQTATPIALQLHENFAKLLEL